MTLLSSPPMGWPGSIDPLRLAERQLARDRARTRGRRWLLARKAARMSASPFAFLRGASPMFYEILAEAPLFAEGPPGEGWICGDLHLENFGAYRPSGFHEEERGPRRRRRVAFGLNDFDDAAVAPLRFDVLRLVTSLLLGAREHGWSGGRALRLCEALLGAYADDATPRAPPCVTALLDRAGKRSHRKLLADRTETVRGRRRFTRGERYRELDPRARIAVEGALREAARGFGLAQDAPELDVEDVAFRVAGTGSLGLLRVAALTRGKGEDAQWIFDLKEETRAASALLVPDRLVPAERVRRAMEACLDPLPRMLGTATIAGRSVLVRRLAPQEDKLDIGRIAREELDDLAAYLGALTRAAHARGARRRLPRWSAADRRAVLDRAVVLAGVHEAAYLAFCRIVARAGLV
jgi:uncharacterized protein (DUF2252 family)